MQIDMPSMQKQSKYKMLHVIIVLEESLENGNNEVKIILPTLCAYYGVILF